MRKTILYLVVLGVLGFGVYFFLFKNHNAFSVNEAGFNIKDTGNIGKIFMANKRGDAITLTRTENGWMVNDYVAITRAVNNLLTTMSQQDVTYPVPQNMHNTAITTLATDGIKVELYGRGGTKMKVFHVGGQVKDNKGSFMLMEGATRPYVVQVPVFEGYLSPRYNVDMSNWRDRTVVALPKEDVRKVKVKYLQEPLNSFTVLQDENGDRSVEIDEALTNGKEMNKRRTDVFLGFFSNVKHEGYLNGTMDLDSIIASVPKRCEIDIEGANEYKQHIDVYWMPINKRSKNRLVPTLQGTVSFDGDRFYGVINNSVDTVILQNATFDKIFRLGYEFYEKDES